MTQQDHHGTRIDVCAAHGVWLDQKELFEITESQRKSEGLGIIKDLFRSRMEPRTDDNRKLPCPHCQKEMRLERYEDVQMDWCPEHGVFLDAGELEAIENNLRLDPVFLRGLALRVSDLKY
jgi:Zn-finger nucleic acid-binding protein